MTADQDRMLDQDLKVLVVGGGSIGRRHLLNLKTLGVSSLGLVEPDANRRAALCAEAALAGVVFGFGTLEAGLAWGPQIAVIATPTHLHVAQALQAAGCGCHLFIEKPLSHTRESLEELAAAAADRELVSLVGCNMRFHPGPAQVKRLLAKQAIGRVLSAAVHTSSYLPEWRPAQDYRHSYSARAELGGGCLLDCIHEIDLTRWYLGEVAEVFCAAEKRSRLEIEAEDTALLICRHHSGALSEIHLDFVCRTYERGCRIIGESGTIFWDFNAQAVKWFDAQVSEHHVFPQPADWQMNQMYREEMRHFLECVRLSTPTMLPISEAIHVLAIVFAAKESASTKRMTETAGTKSF